MPKEMDCPQLLLRKEVLDFGGHFPTRSTLTGENIAMWLKGCLKYHNLPVVVVSGVTPDGYSKMGKRRSTRLRSSW